MSVTQTGTFSDGDGNATVTLTASSGTVTQDNAAGTWLWTAAAEFDGPASTAVTITATDNASTPATASAGFAFNATNAVPVVAITAAATADEGAAVNYSFTATDASPADQTAGFAWMLNFGDGTGSVSVAAGTASPLAQMHTFAGAGIFQVTATAIDKDSGTSTAATREITIMDVTAPQTTITSLAISGGANGGPLFYATMAQGYGGVDTTNDAGLWAVDSTGALRLLVREGDIVGGKALKSFTALTGVSGSPGVTRSFNNAGQIIYHATFLDGSTALVTVQVP